jgi:hypothetical protein
MYMWFSHVIIVLELNLIHAFQPTKSFNLNNLFIYNYHPKSSLMFNFHPKISSILWLSYVYMWKRYFPHHPYMAQKYFKNILSSSKYSKYIHFYLQAHVHKLMFTCSLCNIIGSCWILEFKFLTKGQFKK